MSQLQSALEKTTKAEESANNYITTLSKQLEVLTTVTADARSQHHAAATRNSQLENSLRHATKELETAQQNCTNALQEVDHANKKVQSEEKKVQDEKCNVDAEKMKFANCATELEIAELNLINALQAADLEKKNFENEKNHSEQYLKPQLEEAKAQAKALETELIALKIKANSDVATLSREIEHVTKESGKRLDQASAFEQSLAECVSRHTEAEDALTASRATCAALALEFKNATVNVQHLTNTVEEEQRRGKGLSDLSTRRQQELSEARLQLNEARQQLAHATEELAAKRAQAQTLSESLRSARDETFAEEARAFDTQRTLHDGLARAGIIISSLVAELKNSSDDTHISLITTQDIHSSMEKFLGIEAAL